MNESLILQIIDVKEAELLHIFNSGRLSSKTVIETVVVVQAQVPTDFPVRTLCSACHATGLTNVTYKTGALTWLWCGLLGVWG